MGIFKTTWTREELEKTLPSFTSLRKDRMMPLEYAREVSRWCGAPQYLVLGTVRKLVEEGKLVLLDGMIPVKRVALETLLEGVRPDDEKASGETRGWGLFRKLLAYYIECIRAESGSSCRFWGEKFGKEFIFLRGTGAWYPTSGSGRWQCFLPNLGFDFLKELSFGKKELRLGYPVYVEKRTKEVAGKPETSLSLRPVFCWKIACKPLGKPLAGWQVTLEDAADLPDVNMEWLQRALKKTSQKRAFLDACGLWEDALDDLSENEDGDPECPSLTIPNWSVRDFARILSELFPERLAEPLLPEAVSDAELTSESKSGYYNRAMIFTPRPWPYTKRLVGELEAIGKVEDEILDLTSLKYIFGNCSAVGGGSPVLSDALDVIDFTIPQREAVASMLTSPLTIMQGPPGTGKSQVVAGVTLNERLNRRPVLISTLNHKAIDAVMERVEKLGDTGGQIVFRCNAKERGAGEFGFLQAVRKLLKASPRAAPGESADCQKARERMDRLLDSRKRAEENAARIHQLSSELEARESEKRELEEKAPWLKSLSSLPDQKESVRALETLEKLERFEGRITAFALCHPWRALRLRAWAQRLQTVSASPLLPLWGRIPEGVRAAVREATEVSKRYAEVQEKASSIQKSLTSEPRSASDCSEAMARYSKLIRRELPGHLALDGKVRVNEAIGERNENRALLDRVNTTLWDAASGLTDAKPGTFTNTEFLRGLEKLLLAYPAWAVSALSVGKFIPRVAGLFDLVLIDEATQASIPAAIPLLFRAKRAAVIGDPKQLQFITELRPDKDLLLRKAAGLLTGAAAQFSYCERSLYDLAAGTDGASSVMLNETFRSCAEIAAYSSELFYEGQLLVATDESRLRTPRGFRPGIVWINTQSKVRQTPGGSCKCNEEIEAVSEQVASILVNAGFDGTLGVVTPFAKQAELIERRVNDKVSPRGPLTASNFLSKSAHAFQGDERDVIILSLCCGAQMPKGCLNFVRKDPNIFNVAASRARSLLVIVGDKTWAASCGIPHIEGLTADRRKVYEAQVTEWAPYESPYEKTLGERLRAEGFDVIPQYKVGTFRLDLALKDGSAQLDIEVDSDAWHREPDGRRKSKDAWRDEMLIERGWKPLRIWTFEIDQSLDACVERVRNRWSELLARARSFQHSDQKGSLSR